MLGMQTILVPVDFSKNAERALVYAIDLAETFGAKVHLMHSYLADIGSITAYGDVLPMDYLRELRGGADAKLAGWAARVTQAGLEVETHLSRESPAESIAKIARAIDADLIVMGTRGLTGLKHALLGSVAERAVRLASCPVLTVHEDDARLVDPDPPA